MSSYFGLGKGELAGTDQGESPNTLVSNKLNRVDVFIQELSPVPNPTIRLLVLSLHEP